MFRIRTIIFVLCVFFLNACEKNVSVVAEDAPIANADTSLQEVIDEYLDNYWALNPSAALYSGRYEFDTRLTLPDQASRAQRRQLTETTLAQLQTISATDLSDSINTDRLMLINRLQYSLWSEDELQSWRWDPSNYNVASGFGLILNTEYKPPAERLDAFYQRMAQVPAYYAAAQENIAQPTRPHLALAIQQNRGGLHLFEERFLTLAEEVVPQETLELYWARVDETVAAIEQHINFLIALQEKLEQENNFRSFRLGQSLYAEKFQRQIVTDFNAEEVYQLALDKKRALHAEMAEITNTLWPNYFPSTEQPTDELQAIGLLIDSVAKQHTDKNNFVDAVRQQIAELEAFVIEQDLLDLDPEKPLVVREMPEYQRGVAVASIDAPGPFDPEANTYYNVSPLDDYDDVAAESFLREYNNHTLQILNIHEAIPGHYAQLIHSNKSKSLIKSLFGNGAMVEGWAVYSEQVMMEAGYADNNLELRLMYNKWLLRTVINAIIDHDIHVNNLSEQDALAMMLTEGFQEHTEATGKWRRATLSQVQLSSYFTGYSEILAFRESLKVSLGDNFNLKNFHHQLLSYGSAPVPIIKQLMREDYIKNHK